MTIPLTKKQHEVFRLYILGHMLKDIASIVGRPQKTIQRHLQEAQKTLHVNNRMDALRAAFDMKMISIKFWRNYKML